MYFTAKMSIQFMTTLVFAAVMICWIAFAGVFLLRKKPPSPPDQKREPGSLFGVALQGVAYGLVWGVRRAAFSPILSGNKPVSIFAGLLAICAAVGSVCLITMAVKTLGKQWSITSRLVEGHE